MPITDQRRVTFDLSALQEVLNCSPQAAQSVGMPHTKPTEIVLSKADRTVTFMFSTAVVKLDHDKIGALLIAYCIRTGIRVPRNCQRSVMIEPAAVSLVFREDYASAPVRDRNSRPPLPGERPNFSAAPLPSAT